MKKMSNVLYRMLLMMLSMFGVLFGEVLYIVFSIFGIVMFGYLMAGRY